MSLCRGEEVPARPLVESIGVSGEGGGVGACLCVRHGRRASLRYFLLEDNRRFDSTQGGDGVFFFFFFLWGSIPGSEHLPPLTDSRPSPVTACGNIPDSSL